MYGGVLTHVVGYWRTLAVGSAARANVLTFLAKTLAWVEWIPRIEKVVGKVCIYTVPQGACLEVNCGGVSVLRCFCRITLGAVQSVINAFETLLVIAEEGKLEDNGEWK